MLSNHPIFSLTRDDFIQMYNETIARVEGGFAIDDDTLLAMTLRAIQINLSEDIQIQNPVRTYTAMRKI